MLRLNRFLVSRNVNKLSNIYPNIVKSSQLYYSSEPPDKHQSVRPAEVRPQQIRVEVSDAFFRKTGPELSLFGPYDMRAPLNGNIGLLGLGIEHRKRLEVQTLLKLIQFIPDFDPIQEREENIRQLESLLSDGPQIRCHKLFQILKYQRLVPKEMVCVTKSSETFDCSAHDLPYNTIKKFVSLFPSVKSPELSNGLTVVTMTKKTENDMTSYSEEIELERDNFYEQFISKAKSFCGQLHSNGFWADFIDPYSGQPFLGEQTNETMFETDERFIHLGFKIEDLGCCKAIYHSKWGTHVIVGTIFTTAPADSKLLSELMVESV